MGRYLGKCKGVVGEIAVVGVRTRARAALAMAAARSSTSSLPAKKIRKASTATKRYNAHDLRSRRRVLVASEENFASSSPNCRQETITSSSDFVVVVEATAGNHSGDEFSSDFPASCCSSNNHASSCNATVKDLFEIVADPEQVESAQTSSRHLNHHNEERKERQVEAGESENLDSPARPPDAKSTVEIKMPSDFEIEEFFAVAEKDLHKRFTDRYNFDIVKDVPLEGRYDWVPIKP